MLGPRIFFSYLLLSFFFLLSGCYEMRTYQTEDGNGNTIECVGKSHSFSPGDKIGQHRCWYLDEDGDRDPTRPHMVGSYKNGQADGYFVYWYYHPNGTLKAQQLYEREGVRIEKEDRRGSWTYYDSTGNKIRAEKYNGEGERVRE